MLFVIVYLPSEVVLHTYNRPQTAALVLAAIFFFFRTKILLYTPWQYIRFCGASTYQRHASHMRGAAGSRQPPAPKPSLHRISLQYTDMYTKLEVKSVPVIGTPAPV